MTDETKPLIRYLFEAGELKRIKRSGWWLAKVKDPESVADHSYRTAVVAFVLAELEGVNAEKICSAAAFHDVIETRLLDLHKVNARYVDVSDETEAKVVKDQLANMPKSIADRIQSLYSLSEKERLVLKDADLLECALQAKEYVEVDYPDAQEWLDNIAKLLKTNSGKKLFSTILTSRSSDWWQGLKKL
jgi:putative hydrolase of HD superfamily